jgi:predicted component of type VI protein secretion system
MDFQLVIVRGRSASQSLKLADGVTTVGRHDDCELRIKSSQVSRRHCQLFEKRGMLLVKDLGSSNGTYVNGKRIQDQRVLEPGDEIMIGKVTLRVAKVGQAAPPRPGPVPKGTRPGDTAVVAPLPAGDSDEFEIEFDEEHDLAADHHPIPDIDDGTTIAPPPTNEPKTQPAAVAVPQEDAVADFLLDFQLDGDDEPIPAPPQGSAEVQPSQPAPKDKTAPQAEPAGGDDAIADFLLDIKLDEEE